jgi:hypothetical protein
MMADNLDTIHVKVYAPSCASGTLRFCGVACAAHVCPPCLLDAQFECAPCSWHLDEYASLSVPLPALDIPYRGAGTDANVSMTLYGDKGDTGIRKLDSSQNDFERGKVGKITQIVAAGLGASRSWYLCLWLLTLQSSTAHTSNTNYSAYMLSCSARSPTPSSTT